MDVNKIQTQLQENWPFLAGAAIVGLGLGYVVGSKLATSGTSKRERAACDARVSAAEKQARRGGIVDARRASDAALNDLAARPNPFVVLERGRQIPGISEFDDPRDAREAARYIEALKGAEGLRVGYVRGRSRRQRRGRSR